jgi:hypothetical protein
MCKKLRIYFYETISKGRSNYYPLQEIIWLAPRKNWMNRQIFFKVVFDILQYSHEINSDQLTMYLSI